MNTNIRMRLTLNLPMVFVDVVVLDKPKPLIIRVSRYIYEQNKSIVWELATDCIVLYARRWQELFEMEKNSNGTETHV